MPFDGVKPPSFADRVISTFREMLMLPPDPPEDNGGGGGFNIKHYRLIFKRVKACSLMESAIWMHRNPFARTIGQRSIDGVRVSTIMIGLDHNFSPRGKPVLFESMIFGGPRNQSQWRYRTYGEARRHFMKLCKQEFRESPGENRAYMRKLKFIYRWRPRIKYPFEHRMQRRRKGWRK